MREYPVPQAFGAALEQNLEATNAFAMMTKEQKERVLARANRIHTQAQMDSLISILAEDRSI